MMIVASAPPEMRRGVPLRVVVRRHFTKSVWPLWEGKRVGLGWWGWWGRDFLRRAEWVVLSQQPEKRKLVFCSVARLVRGEPAPERRVVLLPVYFFGLASEMGTRGHR